VPRSDLPASSSDGTTAHSAGYRASSYNAAASSASKSSYSSHAYNNNYSNSSHADNSSNINSKQQQHVEVKVHVDEYAYNKIFVGGLHYDTRDGKQAMHPIPSLLLAIADIVT